MPLVSIIMPAYNACNRIAQTIESVLSQRFADLELIVVDDGSTDHTVDVAARYAVEDSRVRVLSIPNGGPSAARNAGMAAASGTYLMSVSYTHLDVYKRQLLYQGLSTGPRSPLGRLYSSPHGSKIPA